MVGVLSGGRLVEYEHSGGAYEQRGERQPLPAALAELPWAGVLEPAEPEEVDGAWHVEHRILGLAAKPEAELKLGKHVVGEQHLVGRLEQQRHVRGVFVDPPRPDRLAAEPDVSARRRS